MLLPQHKVFITFYIYILEMKIDYRSAELLSGGACKGFYYTGYIKAKEELGLTDQQLGKKTLKIGVSIGSLFAAAMAVGVTFKDINEYIYKNQSSLKNLFNASLLNPLLRFKLSKDENGYRIGLNGKEIANTGISDTKILEKIVDDFIGNAKFRDYEDLTIVGCSFPSGEEIIFNYKEYPDTNIKDAVLTSATVPGVFPTRKFVDNDNIKYTVDGGIYMNFPLDYFLTNRKVKNIIAIDLMNVSEENPKELPKNALQMFLAGNFVSTSQKTGILFKYILHKDYEEAIREQIFKAKVYIKESKGKIKQKFFGAKKNILFINPKIGDEYFAKTDIKHFEELVKMGYEECKPLLKKFYGLNKKG